MTLDERALRAADDLRTAGRQARFTVRTPGVAVRRRRLALAVATLVAVAGPLLWSLDRDRPMAPGGTNLPPASVTELVDAYVSALGTRDAPSLHGLSAENVAYGGYLVAPDPSGRPSGRAVGYDDALGYFTGQDPVLVEADPPIISGEAVAIPVRFVGTETTSTGVIVLTITSEEGDPRVASSVFIVAAPGIPADPDAAAVQGQFVEAWNSGDAETVMPFYAADALVWDSLAKADPDLTFHGASVRIFVGSSMWFTVETTARPTAAGPFLVVPSTLHGPGDTSDGITVLLVVDGVVAFHGFAQ